MKYPLVSQITLMGLRVTLTLVILSLNFGGSGTKTAYAAPSNDNFPGTIISGIPFADIVDTTSVTEEADDPQVNVYCDNKLLNKGEKSVWYTFTPGATQSVTMDTLGSTPSSYDTYIAVWTGTHPNLTYVVCDDDTPMNLQSKLTTNVQAGVTYYIEVAGYSGLITDLVPVDNPGGHLVFHLGFVTADTVGVFRPDNAFLYLKNTNTTGFADVAINYGLREDYPIVGDWDGNGTVTIGIYREGSFYLRNSNILGFADIVFAFGLPGDQPVAGDWNGDGIDTIGIYRTSTGQFLLRDSNSAGTADYSFYLGNAGDIGIAGDWTGRGYDRVGVFRPSNGMIFLHPPSFENIQLNYGLPGDYPVIGDWNGDGIDTIGVYRNGQFLLRNSNTIGFADISFYLGNPGDMPIAGDWDGLP